MSREDGEGVIMADIALGEVPGAHVTIPDRFWIPEMPEGDQQWQAQLKRGHDFYVSHTLPFLKKRFRR